MDIVKELEELKKEIGNAYIESALRPIQDIVSENNIHDWFCCIEKIIQLLEEERNG